MTTWPNGHIIILAEQDEPWITGMSRLTRCDCNGMSADNPSHRLGPVTDSLAAGRMFNGRDAATGRKL